MKPLKNMLMKFGVLGVFFGMTVVFGMWILLAYIIPATQTDVKAPLSLHGDPEGLNFPRSKEVRLEMVNTLFMLNEKIAFNVQKLHSKIYPKEGYPLVDFDDVNSFFIDIYNGRISLKAGVMETVFNDIVFKYPGAPLKNLKMNFINVRKGDRDVGHIELKGEMYLLGMWLNFTMVGRPEIDKKNNLMVMIPESVKAVGFPYALGFMKGPFSMESLMKIPDGRGVKVDGNSIIISPFRIFPPPALSGKLARISIDVERGLLNLEFDREEKLVFPPPKVEAKSYLMLKKGVVKFGKLVMHDADLLMVDADPSDTFVFYLSKYSIPLGKGKSLMKGDRSVIAYMPDYDDVAGK